MQHDIWCGIVEFWKMDEDPLLSRPKSAPVVVGKTLPGWTDRREQGNHRGLAYRYTMSHPGVVL